MKILITGSNGYIGRSLADHLGGGHEIVAINRKVVDLSSRASTNLFFQQSCGDGNYFDLVIHAAVEGGSRLKTDGESVLFNNLKMYYNLLENKNFYSRFISFGSGAELLMPDTPYGFSKKIITDSISGKDGFFNIRIYGLFDENELPTRFIKANILRYINKQPMVIHEDRLMDFFYMEDLKSLIDCCLIHKEFPNIVSCSYPHSYLLSEIAQQINDLDAHKVEIISSGRSNFDYKAYQNNNCEFAYNLIKCIGVEEGIKATYQKLKAQK